jgi:hypothetical protein
MSRLHAIRLIAVILSATFSICSSVAVEAAEQPSATVRQSPDGTGLWFDGFIDDPAVAREVYLCGRMTSSLFGHAMPPIAPDRHAAVLESWTALRKRHELFFNSIGVNEYMTRAGQEPLNLTAGLASGSYTYDLPTMQRFGLHNIQAVEGYGTEAWCSAINKDAERPIGCVQVTGEMLEYDRVRKERGEECQPDRTLATRPSSQ